MLYLSLSIFSSCTLLWLFRYFSNHGRNIPGIITVNYLTCFAATLWVHSEKITLNSLSTERFGLYACLMGGLFLLTFNIISRTVTFFGIMISSVVQKMSLISPILIGVLFYSENLSLLRITGIIAAVSAIIVINMPFDKGEDNQRKRTMWIYPFLTWLLSSVIDAAFFIIGKTSGKEQSSLFLVILFGTAAILGILFFLIHQRKQETVFPLHIFPLGILLGVPNFMSIYYLMKTISQGWDASLIFPVNNVGIISFSMLGALIIFKETTNKFKIAGIGLAIAAVLLITLS